MKLDFPLTFDGAKRVVNWALMRRPPSAADSALSPAGVLWLSRIPIPARPLLLSKRFPRIVNELAKVWDRDDKLRPYMADLLLDNRGDRKGFPFEILEELSNLSSYYDEVLVPSRKSVWQDTNLF